MDFKVSEVINQRNRAGHFWNSELDYVAIEAYRSSCLVFHNFPLSVFRGEEVGHSAAEHAHQGITLGEMDNKSFL